MIFHQPRNSMGNYNYNAYLYQHIRYEPHFHRNFELLCVRQGDLSVTVNGAGQALSQGELLLIPPNAVHAFDVRGESQVWVCRCTPPETGTRAIPPSAVTQRRRHF